MLFDAFAGIARIYAACGPTMMIVAKNDQNNLAKARTLTLAQTLTLAVTLTLNPNPNPSPNPNPNLKP